jgi:pyroglutamyl-peptidase
MHMPKRPALITGFAPYGGRGRNPAAEIAKTLDGTSFSGISVVGRLLPVSFGQIAARTAELLEELQPVVVLSIGLWPGEPLIRIERAALNVADFEIADNDGCRAHDEPVLGNGTAAKLSSVPLRKIEAALLAAGIPARVSNTAGTFLCNACLYSFLSAAEATSQRTSCGFLHVPYTPEQVAALLQELKQQGRLEAHQRADLASMDLATSTRAVQIAVETAIRESA